MSDDARRHIPVLLDEVVAAVDPRPGRRILDGTFGAGGYTRAFLDRGADVIAIDRDPSAVAAGQALMDASGGRLTLVEGRFGELDSIAAGCGAAVDAVVLDIGVSSMQLDQSERGFSFQADGPLDMRMAGAASDETSAAEWLNHAEESDIADVLYHYGEERQSRRVARAIVAARPLATTGDLARVVRKALGHAPGAPKDPATRSFQAVRIHVNDELGELGRALAAAERLLGEGGRLAVVSFHSLEDRAVKQFLRARSGGDAAPSRHLPSASNAKAPTFTSVSRAIRPGEVELARNPRARSATLRFATRTAAPAWPAAPATHRQGETAR